MHTCYSIVSVHRCVYVQSIYLALQGGNDDFHFKRPILLMMSLFKPIGFELILTESFFKTQQLLFAGHIQSSSSRKIKEWDQRQETPGPMSNEWNDACLNFPESQLCWIFIR